MVYGPFRVGHGLWPIQGRTWFGALQGRIGFVVLQGRIGFGALQGRIGFGALQGRIGFGALQPHPPIRSPPAHLPPPTHTH